MTTNPCVLESCPAGCTDPHYDENGRLECYYGPDGALVLPVPAIRRIAEQHGVCPTSDLVDEVVEAAIAGWDAVVELQDTMETFRQYYSPGAFSFVQTVAYYTDGPTYDGRAIRVEGRV